MSARARLRQQHPELRVPRDIDSSDGSTGRPDRPQAPAPTFLGCRSSTPGRCHRTSLRRRSTRRPESGSSGAQDLVRASSDRVQPFGDCQSGRSHEPTDPGSPAAAGFPSTCSCSLRIWASSPAETPGYFPTIRRTSRWGPVTPRWFSMRFEHRCRPCCTDHSTRLTCRRRVPVRDDGRGEARCHSPLLWDAVDDTTSSSGCAPLTIR
jgi:hypothetical protein